MRSTITRTGAAAVLAAVLALGAAACGGEDDSSGGSAGAAARAARSPCCCRSPRPPATSSRTARTSSARVKELCADCEVIYANAEQDPAKQQQQAEQAITSGAKVLVLDAVDVKSAGASSTRAKQARSR